MPANRIYSPNNPVGYEITLMREIDAPRKLVFAAWADENHVKQWWGPAGFDNPVCKVDARVGGKMDIHMRGPDGTVYPMTATFVEIVPEEKIVFTSGALDAKGSVLFEILHTVTFSDAGKKTRLALTACVLSARSEGAHHIGGMEEGWSGSLDKLVIYTKGKANMSARLNTEGDTADRELVVSRIFDAPRELVWEAMANPQHVVNWWGPVGFTTTTEKMDLRPGGEWIHVMRGPDGANYPNHSTFTEVVKPERIVYVHGGKREGGPAVHFVMTWTFERVSETQTRLTLRQVYENKEMRDLIVKEYGAAEGAKQTLARLAEFLDPDKVIVERSFHAPIDVVWRAITEPAQMKQWYFPAIQTFKPELGFEVRVNTECDGKTKEHLWKITEVVPGRKIAYSWNYTENRGNSAVSWELFDEGKTTRLRLVHTGLQSFQPEKNPGYTRGGFFGGWTYFAGRLRDFVEKAG